MTRSIGLLLLLVATLLPACSAQKSDAAGGSSAGAGENAGGTNAGGTSGGTSAVDSGVVSGTRLRAQYLTTADGARQFFGWFDKNLNVSCHFGMADDGRIRCLPDSGALVGAAFLDANCTQQLAQFDASSCAGPPTFVLKSSTGDCGPSSEVYAVGAAQTPSQVFYSSSTGCAASPTPTTQKFYALGAKADAATFLDAASAGVPSGHRLDPIFTIASDGAKQRTGWFDSTMHGECVVSVAADQKMRCLPSTPAIVLDTFSDAACSAPLAQSVANAQCGSSDTPTFAFKIDTNACPAATHLYAITGKLAATQVYVQQAGACAAAAAGTATYYQVTELNPPEFDLFLPVQSGAERLLQPALVDADGAAELSRTLFDSQRNEACGFAQAADGKTRCLPSGASALFTNANCMQPVAVATPDCAGNAPHYAELLEGDACTGGTGVHALGSTMSVSSVYAPGADGSCMPSAAPGATFYGVGAEVDATQFVAATSVTE